MAIGAQMTFAHSRVPDWEAFTALIVANKAGESAGESALPSKENDH